jgi:hypothetical protein
MSDEQKTPNDDTEPKHVHEGDVQDDPVKLIAQEIEVAGGKVLETVRALAKEGQVRRVIVKAADDRVLLDTPLNVGLGLGGAVALLGGLPLMLLSAGVAALARVKVKVIREVRDGDVVNGGEVHIDPDDDDSAAT